jgi:protein ImuB
MVAISCVNVRAIALQLLLRAHPEWKSVPAVVLDKDAPNGIVQHSNKAALRRRIFPGLRHAAALSLCNELRSGVVADAAIEAATAAITRHLWAFSPDIEASKEAGIFWLNASGMQNLFPSLEVWANGVACDLNAQGFRAVVAVGFSRFGAYAAAKSSKRNLVFAAPRAERDFVRNVPLAVLLRNDNLAPLGVSTLGAFIDLPAGSIFTRFGAEAADLHRLAQHDGWSSLTPVLLREAVAHCESLDHPEDNTERLLFRFAHILSGLIAELRARHEQLKGFVVSLTLGDKTTREVDITPASPTLDSKQILGLLRLKLDRLALSAPVVALRAHATGARIVEHQTDLFNEAELQNLEAANRAIATLCAMYGNDAVVMAELSDAHLPRAKYQWVQATRQAVLYADAVETRPLMRRMHTPALSLGANEKRQPDGWLILGLVKGPVEEVVGPDVVNNGNNVDRMYFYVRTSKGGWHQIFWDRIARCWYMQATVM